MGGLWEGYGKGTVVPPKTQANETCKLLGYKNLIQLIQVTKILYTSQTRVPMFWVPGNSVDERQNGWLLGLSDSWPLLGLYMIYPPKV